MNFQVHTRHDPLDRSTTARPTHRLSTRSQFQRHDRVFVDPDVQCLTVVKEGWICRSRMTFDGRRQILGIFLPGDACDHGGALTGLVDYTINALSPVLVEVRLIDMTDAAAMLRYAAAGIAISARWIARLGQRSATQKLTDLVDELITRQCLDKVDYVRSADFKLTQCDLADATGLTAIHVNRTLRELREANILYTGRGKIEVPSMSRLRDAAARGA